MIRHPSAPERRERLAMANGHHLPAQRCTWSVNQRGEVYCTVYSRLKKACADALRLRRDHPGKRAYVRLHRQCEQDRRAHRCEDVPGGEVAANQRAERVEAAAREVLDEGPEETKPGAPLETDRRRAR